MVIYINFEIIIIFLKVFIWILFVLSGFMIYFII
ncbi:hypothetical protein MsAc7_15270 [Methanolapillus millepedarum]|uniref:Uncharacterized protein n=1 Tax=Methanolapillus millepedarum TaxID=3028296 RepID=A0AA96ZUP1_9EURY|nr:hypothetical protein MsAc7_15270 [Methanosarcinaceae archaeon Ac7]